MGAVTVRTVFYILMLCISGGLFLYTLLAGGMTWIKASNAGILQFHKLFHRIFYWCYYGIVIVSLIVSIVNFTEAYRCQKVIEVIQTQEYIQKMQHDRQNGFFYLFMAMLWFSMMMLNTGFITAAGYYPMGAQKPKKLLVESKEGELQFYLLSEQKHTLNKPILKLKDTPENRKQFAPLFRKRKTMKGNGYAGQKTRESSAGSTKTVTIYRRRDRAGGKRSIENRG